MSYLYGDSTPSKLAVNYIELLRDSVEFCVQVLLADQRIAQGRVQTDALESEAMVETERLQKLGALVSKAFEAAALGAADSASARCAAAIQRSAGELVSREAIALRSSLDAEIARRDAQAVEERDGSVKALETLLVKHDLPDMSVDLHLVVTGVARYACRARVKTGFGLEAVLDLDVPADNLFERVVRVDRLFERLDIQAPEIAGWLHKEVKQRTQHLEKHHVSELSIGAGGAGGAGGTTLKLRLGADGTGAGFDVLFAKDVPGVRLTRVDQQEGGNEEQFDADEADAKKLVALLDKLAKAAGELTTHRRRLVEAKIDGDVMRTHAKPTVLVERLIATMAPVVQEISARSQSPDELVLRRLLAGDRREEVFMAKSELKAKLEPLVEASRALFDPLWIAALPPVTTVAPTKVTVFDPPPPPPPKPPALPIDVQPMRHRSPTPPLGSHSAITVDSFARPDTDDDTTRPSIAATVQAAVAAAEETSVPIDLAPER